MLAAAAMSVMSVQAAETTTQTPATTQSTTTAADSTERVECNVVAVIVSGRRVPGFETSARGPDGASACRKALMACRNMLNDARESTGLDLPSAECQPLETTQLVPNPLQAPATAQRRDGQDSAEAQQARTTDPSCNIAVCSQRYRSFRATDCTFQPYNGPRRRCRF